MKLEVTTAKTTLNVTLATFKKKLNIIKDTKRLTSTNIGYGSQIGKWIREERIDREYGP